jgi:hypothetical protein
MNFKESTMSESTLIKADEANVFIDEWDDGGVWLSVQTRCGGAHCTIPADQIQSMITALQAILAKETA